MAPSTPAAMVERGTTSGQRVVRSTVAELPEAVLRAGLRPPALFVIGPTIDHAPHLQWFSSRPLHGERLVLVPPAQPLVDTLESAGVELVQVPIPVTPAARVVMNALPITGYVFRSAQEVDTMLHEAESSSTIAWCLSEDAMRQASDLNWGKIEYIEASETDISTTLVARMIARKANADCSSQT